VKKSPTGTRREIPKNRQVLLICEIRVLEAKEENG